MKDRYIIEESGHNYIVLDAGHDQCAKGDEGILCSCPNFMSANYIRNLLNEDHEREVKSRNKLTQESE